VSEQEPQRQAKHRLAVIRHAREVTGNVALTFRYYGISRHTCGSRSGSTTSAPVPITRRLAARSGASTRPQEVPQQTAPGRDDRRTPGVGRALRRLLQRGPPRTGPRPRKRPEACVRVTRQGAADCATGTYLGEPRVRRDESIVMGRHDPLQGQAPSHRDGTSARGNPHRPAGLGPQHQGSSQPRDR
jgi:hypothetical protein